MGDYDRQPDDWDRYADSAWAPEHVIFCNSKWMGQDRHSHRTPGDVRECYRAAIDERAGTPVWPCDWHLEGRYDDGSRCEYPCGQPARYTDERGSTACLAGHSHVPAEVRMEQGWDYAEDEQEAAMLRRHGTEARAMDGTGI